MRSTGPLVALAATGTVLLLAGCAGTSGDDGLTYEDSPLTKYVTAAYGGDMSPEEQQKKMQEDQRTMEDLVATCMAEEGFEYAPNTDTGGMVVSDSDNEWEPDKREWVEKYGYGMVNSPFAEQQEEDAAEEYVDPNQEYLESLSDSEQTAFYETLYGVTPDEEDLGEDGSYEYRWEDAGCQGAAQHEVDGDNVWQSDEFADLRGKMEELWTSSMESPEMADLNAEWASCMAEGGEPGFTTQSEASQSINDEQNALYDKAFGDGSEPLDTESSDFVDPSDSPEMKALGEREIELALVDLECRDKTSYLEESLKLQFAREEKFIADNKAELDAFKAAAEQSK